MARISIYFAWVISKNQGPRVLPFFSCNSQKMPFYYESSMVTRILGDYKVNFFGEQYVFQKKSSNFLVRFQAKTLTLSQIWIHINVNSISCLYCACLMLFTWIKVQIWAGKEFLLEILGVNWKITFLKMYCSPKTLTLIYSIV